MAKTTVYLIVQPQWDIHYKHRSGPHTGLPRLKGVLSNKLFQKKPPRSSVPPNGIVVEIEIDIDDEAFYPICPKVSIDIPVSSPPNQIVSVARVTKPRLKSAAAKVVDNGNT